MNEIQTLSREVSPSCKRYNLHLSSLELPYVCKYRAMYTSIHARVVDIQTDPGDLRTDDGRSDDGRGPGSDERGPTRDDPTGPP